MYDTPHQIGFYPLVEWNWTRQDCLDYLQSLFGVVWPKSACVYCVRREVVPIEWFNNNPGDSFPLFPRKGVSDSAHAGSK